MAALSDPIPLGTAAPAFTLPVANPEADGRDGATRSLGDYADAPALLVAFICNHCPYVHEVEPRLIALAEQTEGLQVVAISSNDAAQYPADSFENMAARAREKGYPFPYLYDESQEVARAYQAACTPDFFLFDGDRRLAYAGRMDDGRPTRPSREGQPVTTHELADAVAQVLAGEPVTVEQVPSIGCSIKWR